MTWRIPPVGWCAVCLRVRDEERPAMALWKGTGLCQEHLEQVLPDELLVEAAGAEDEQTVLGQALDELARRVVHEGPDDDYSEQHGRWFLQQIREVRAKYGEGQS